MTSSKNSESEKMLEELQKELTDTETQIRKDLVAVQTTQSAIGNDRAKVEKLKANIKSLQDLESEVDKIYETYVKFRKDIWKKLESLEKEILEEQPQYDTELEEDWLDKVKPKIESVFCKHRSDIDNKKASISKLEKQTNVEGGAAESIQLAQQELESAQTRHTRASEEFGKLRNRTKSVEAEWKVLQATWEAYLEAERARQPRVAYYLFLEMNGFSEVSGLLNDLQLLLPIAQKFHTDLESRWQEIFTESDQVTEAELTLKERQDSLANIEKLLQDTETNGRQRNIDTIKYYDPNQPDQDDGSETSVEDAGGPLAHNDTQVRSAAN